MGAAAPNRGGLGWQSVIVVLISVGLIAWFLRGVNLRELRHTLTHAHPVWIAASVVALLQTYVFRALRWQVLLAPIGGASFRNSFRITVMGFTATNLLPGRLGEVLRPYLISRAEPVNAAAAFATVLIERLLDMASIVLLFSWFLLTTTVDVGPSVKWAGVATAGTAAALLGLLTFGAGHPDTLRGWGRRITRALPDRLAGPADRFAHTLVDGLLVMRRPRNILGAGALSVLLWVSIALGIWTSSLAVDLTLTFPATFLVSMYLVVGVAVPVPAGVGSYHFMFQLAVTSFFGASRDQAAAGAIMAHVASILPISVLGMVFLAQDGWTLARLQSVEPDGGPR